MFIMAYFDQFFNQKNPSFSIVIEDDDKVCYAYLYHNHKIVGDVWIYNSVETVDIVDWRNKEDLPFANPNNFVKINIMPFNQSSQINVSWGVDNNIVFAEIYLVDALLVRLKEGACPGWSTLVKEDDPLALIYMDRIA